MVDKEDMGFREEDESKMAEETRKVVREEESSWRLKGYGLNWRLKLGFFTITYSHEINEVT